MGLAAKEDYSGLGTALSALRKEVSAADRRLKAVKAVPDSASTTSTRALTATRWFKSTAAAPSPLIGRAKTVQ